MTLAIYCICYMDNFDVLEAQRSHGRRKPDRIFDQAVKRSSCAEAESMPRPAVRHRPSHDPVGLYFDGNSLEIVDEKIRSRVAILQTITDHRIKVELRLYRSPSSISQHYPSHIILRSSASNLHETINHNQSDMTDPSTSRSARPGSLPFGSASAYADTFLSPPRQVSVSPTTCYNLSLFKGECSRLDLNEAACSLKADILW
jgi:hypothetical protein